MIRTIDVICKLSRLLSIITINGISEMFLHHKIKLIKLLNQKGIVHIYS